MSSPPIDEIVDLLNSHAPAALNQLRATFPEQSALLTPGMLAGEALTADWAVCIGMATAGLGVAK